MKKMGDVQRGKEKTIGAVNTESDEPKIRGMKEKKKFREMVLPHVRGK